MVDCAQRASRGQAWYWLCWRWLGLVFLLGGLAIVRPAQSGQRDKPENARFVEGSPQAAAAAASTVALRDAFGALSKLFTAQALSLWDGPPPVPQEKALSSGQAPRIDPDLLAGVEDKTPVHNASENYNEAQAYNYLLVQANATSVAAFAKSARRDLTFAHLFEEPSKYRGQVVHIEGRLGRLRRFDAPRLAIKQGIPVLYEGWIFGDAYFSNPYCIIATFVPESIPLGETLNHRVAFDGYFFKRYRYRAGDGWRDAPLLIGHALVDRQATSTSTDADGSFTSLLLPALVTILGATVMLVVGLNWWFRRGDRRLRTHLDMNRNANFVEPGPDSP
jgi:hypothetical protein